MTAALGLLGVATAWGVGMAVASAFAPGDRDRVTFFGLAYGVGLVWISTCIGGAALVGVPLAWPVGLAVVLVAAAARGMRFRRRSGGEARSAERAPREIVADRDPWWWAGAALVGVLWLIAASRAALKPVQGWDAWTDYTFKAKAIFLDGAISNAMFSSVVAPNYPLGVSLQEVWIAWFMGTWDDVGIKWLFPGYLLALIGLVYGALREHMSPRIAIAGTLAATGFPLLLQHAQDGYTDLPFAYFALGNAVALTAYARRDDRRHLLVAAVMAAGLVWTRADGAGLVACSALVLAAYDVRRRGVGWRSSLAPVSVYVAPAVAVWGTWTFVTLSLNLPSNLESDAAHGVPVLARWASVLGSLAGALFLDGNWGIYWAMAALAALYRFHETFESDMMFFVWPSVAYIGMIVVLFGTTGLSRFVLDGTVIHRVVLHVVPVTAIWVVLAFGRWWGVAAPPRTGSAA
ncbi:MAG: hypothetical protein ACOYXU_12915 [Nitrospirota bacterium]